MSETETQQRPDAPERLRLGIVGDNLLGQAVWAAFGGFRQVERINPRDPDKIDEIVDAKPTIVYVCMEIPVDAETGNQDDTDFITVVDKLVKQLNCGICVRNAMSFETMKRLFDTLGGDKFVSKVLYNPVVGDPYNKNDVLSPEVELIGGHPTTIEQHLNIINKYSHYMSAKVLTGNPFEICFTKMAISGYRAVRQTFFDELTESIIDSQGCNPSAVRRLVAEIPYINERDVMVPSIVRAQASLEGLDKHRKPYPNFEVNDVAMFNNVTDKFPLMTAVLKLKRDEENTDVSDGELIKNSKLKHTEVMSKSQFFQDKELVPTDVPMMNVALTGALSGGVSSGLTVLAGPSKHFKTSFALKMASAYLNAKPDAVMLFYDSEFGSPQSYFDAFGIDTSRVLHTPITDVEELKFDLVNQLDQIDTDDDVIIVIDSIGNLASKKELEDALNEKSVADMSRAKALKGLFRMTTPYLAMKNVPLLAINHTYKEIGLFPKDIVGGGTGIYYSADNIWIIGRRQNKTGTEVTGYDFIINVEKSRYVKEKSKIPISVSWEGGVERFSGLLDVALAGGWVTKPSNGWYQRVDKTTGEVLGTKVREKETLTEEFWSDIMSDLDFGDFVQKQYCIGYKSEVEMDFEHVE